MTPRPRGTVDRILDAAQELFYATSVDAVGVDAISARSGVSKSTLYRHFPAKAELVAGYLQRAHERRLGAWREALTAPGTPATERILGLFDWLGAGFDADGFRGCQFVNAAAQLADASHPAYAIPRSHKAEIEVLLAEVGREAGAIDADELARELILLVDGAMVHALLEPGGAHALRARRLAELTLAERGIAVRART